MEYCGPRGIPRLHFLGGPPGWTEHDRAAALWWLIYQRQTCQNCGTRPAEWEEDDEAYVPVVRHCRGCEVKARGDEDFERHRRHNGRGPLPTLVGGER
jgi:hypothetical protein